MTFHLLYIFLESSSIGIAKRGRYGAFLMEELDLLNEIVSTLSQGLKIPVTCKTRIYHDFDRTIRLCETLSNAGASLLTIHGRTREEKQQLIGPILIQNILINFIFHLIIICCRLEWNAFPSVNFSLFF